MDSTYLYSGTYTNVLTARLLSANQRELLLGTTSVAEVQKLLQDTALAPLLTSNRTIRQALNDYVVAQKVLLEQLAPLDEQLSIVFLRYDYENLKQITVGKIRNETEEVLLERCSPLGTLPPSKLLTLVTNEQLVFTHPALAEAYRRAQNLRAHEHIGDIFDFCYLMHARSIAEKSPLSFIERYVSLLIDTYNLGMRLRVLTHPDSDSLIVSGTLVPGGTIRASDLETLERATATAERFSSDRHWKEAVTKLTSNRDFSDLDRAFDNHLMQFLKRESIEIHSIVSLVAYFHAILEETQFIGAIITGHNAGLPGPQLRNLVRSSFTHYAY